MQWDDSELAGAVIEVISMLISNGPVARPCMRKDSIKVKMSESKVRSIAVWPQSVAHNDDLNQKRPELHMH